MPNTKFPFDSPLFTHLTEENMLSPMSELANNLGTASLGSSVNVRRKLSLSNVEESPCAAIADTPMMVSPLPDTSHNRLLKNALKFSSCNTPIGTGGMKRVIPRRLSQLGDNENQPPSTITCSPVKTSPSKFAAVRQVSGIRSRLPLEDHDPNSQDSGFSFSEDSKSSTSSSNFRFAEPSGLAPRRNVAESPRRSSASINLFHSSSSSEAVDDGFIEFMSPVKMPEEEAHLPPGMGGLILAPIISSCVEQRRTTFRRCISENFPARDLTSDILAPGKRPLQEEIVHSPQTKRHKPLSEVPENIQTPRRGTLFEYGFTTERAKLVHSVSVDTAMTIQKNQLKYSSSESETIIKNALSRSIKEDLIGDFSLPFALPLINGVHQDLKCISSDTLARLINGEYSTIIEHYEIIDCRYPYEFDGGHIKGAKNIYTKDQVIKEFVEKLATKSESGKRHVLIFHCEFSSERGPTLSRFLRSRDRTLHTNEYPALAYPEMYLLNGGYKSFYASHKELCEPRAYRKMVDVNKEELQHFRAKSKTWSGDSKVRQNKRSTSFMRLGI